MKRDERNVRMALQKAQKEANDFSDSSDSGSKEPEKKKVKKSVWDDSDSSCEPPSRTAGQPSNIFYAVPPSASISAFASCPLVFVSPAPSEQPTISSKKAKLLSTAFMSPLSKEPSNLSKKLPAFPINRFYLEIPKIMTYLTWLQMHKLSQVALTKCGQATNAVPATETPQQ